MLQVSVVDGCPGGSAQPMTGGVAVGSGAVQAAAPSISSATAMTLAGRPMLSATDFDLTAAGTEHDIDPHFGLAIRHGQVAAAPRIQTADGLLAIEEHV